VNKFELKISLKDWLYIIVIGILFGLFISLVFYFLVQEFHQFSTIIFGISNAFFIALYSLLFISLSNRYILPNIEPEYWSLMSFLFSFGAGAFGFSTVILLFADTQTMLIKAIMPYSIPITFIMGFLTFLIGLVLHQFIAMKYKHQEIQTQMLNNQIKALENELNPHFLYNALNSISELIHIDQNKAENAVLDLSRFLRNALNFKESLISLHQEIEMVNNYIRIENIRFAGQIQLHVNIEESMKNRKIPKFSIQLLAENAIKHGYEAKELNIYIEAKNFTVKVKNDGKRPSIVTFGTGLNNLKKRLQLLMSGNLDYRFSDEGVEFLIMLEDEG
jgi:LytS/YehU family sensor histidine kinase